MGKGWATQGEAWRANAAGQQAIGQDAQQLGAAAGSPCIQLIMQGCSSNGTASGSSGGKQWQVAAAVTAAAAAGPRSLLQPHTVVAPLVLAHHCLAAVGRAGLFEQWSSSDTRWKRGTGTERVRFSGDRAAQQAPGFTFLHVLLVRFHAGQVQPVGRRQRDLHPAAQGWAARAGLAAAGAKLSMRQAGALRRTIRQAGTPHRLGPTILLKYPPHQWYRPSCPASSSAGSPGSSTTASSGARRRTGRGTAAL